MNEIKDRFPASPTAPSKQIPTSDYAMTLQLGIILVLHIILGIVCFDMLGLTFLLSSETEDWFLFLPVGAASCAVGVAASGLSAYFSARGGGVRSLLFALPVLLLGMVATIGQFPSVSLPIIVWCTVGVSMFVSSHMGGLAGAIYGKKRHPTTMA